LFNAACDRVVLMMKRRPAWQAGRWNGVGGKVEPGEDIHTAMHREAAEEIGVRPIWLHYVNLEYPEAHIAFFGSRSQPSFDQAQQLTDERIYWHNMGAVLGGGLKVLVPNLRFLIPMAVHALARENIVATTIPVYGEANAVSRCATMLKSVKPSTACNEHDRARAAPGRYGHTPPIDTLVREKAQLQAELALLREVSMLAYGALKALGGCPRCAPGSSPCCFRHPFREPQTRGKPTLWRKYRRPTSTTTWTRRRSIARPASHQGWRFTGRLRHRERQLGRRRGALDRGVAPGLRECIPVRSVQLVPSHVDWHQGTSPLKAGAVCLADSRMRV